LFFNVKDLKSTIYCFELIHLIEAIEKNLAFLHKLNRFPKLNNDMRLPNSLIL